jgi:chemotaxis protein MotB
MAGGGGAWKVAYADFVTAMMAFFLVMWITAQSKPVKQAIAQYFNDPMKTGGKGGANPTGGSPFMPSQSKDLPGPSPMPSTKAGNATGEKQSHATLWTPKRGGPSPETEPPKKKETPSADRPRLFLVHNGDRQYIGTMVLFPEGSYEIDQEAQRRLKRLALELRGLPHKIEIRGHATRRPASPGGPPQDAWGLSYRRCLAVMEFLEEHGVEQSRMRLSQGGPFEPYSLGTDAAKLANNSRVDVQMLSEYAEDSVGTPEERSRRFRNEGESAQASGQ